MSNYMTLGVIGTSNKENEHRVPIAPGHFSLIAAALRKNIYVEAGYGEMFGVSDEEIGELVAGIRTREQLFAECDIILLPKPTKEDFPSFKEGQVLWGWPHCVQGEAITQTGIDKKMTYIAWEEMHIWRSGQWDLHVFQKNNELAGYCSVLHALQLAGMTGHYGPPKKAAVISFGSTGRGAIHALQGMGYHDVTVFTKRPYQALATQIPGLKHRQYQRLPDNENRAGMVTKDGLVSFAAQLSDYDIIVNCIMQDTDRPLMFIAGDEIDDYRPGSLIIDVSCDEGMGFDFAKPTSFIEPAFKVGHNVLYYAVDHSPSYLWRAATHEISLNVIYYLPDVMAGEAAWEANETIRRSIEMKDGVIQNPKILRFQKRAADYPHKKQG
ncbi:MAG TPA: N(5)-(carboxyethyl)ornithine synthase [Anaerolineae bacterium]|nr:N(5)-(carboxyethyl)ornithine synthase [Anaerolineae bacterium]